jgi:CBS domain-containing protein
MKCEDVMTKDPICCLPEDGVVQAAKKMTQNDIGSLPVIESEDSRKIVGILTDRDLVLKVVGEGLDPQSVLVKEVMTKNVITCFKEDDLQRAMDAMADYQLRRIPVLDNGNRIVGIIAQADIATRLDQPEKTASVVKDISKSVKE